MGNRAMTSMLMNITGLGSIDDPFRIREISSSLSQSFATDVDILQFPSTPPQPSGPPSSLCFNPSRYIQSYFSYGPSSNAAFSSSAVPPPPTSLPQLDLALNQYFTSQTPPTSLPELDPTLGPYFMSQTPRSSFARQYSPSSSFNTSSNSVDDNGEIEFSTPRPRIKRSGAQVLRFKVPRDVSRIPPRNSTSSSPSTAGSSNPSPTSTSSSSSGLTLAAGNGEASSPIKAQRARLDEKGTKRLLVKLKIGSAASKLRNIGEMPDA